MSYRVGIDVGGTFTDFLVLGGDGTRLVHKTSSTPGDPSLGLVTGLEEIAVAPDASLAEFLAEVELIVHGTTVTTNALLTRRGAATGLLCTEGFRDALALRQGTREAPYDNRLQPPEPLVPRYLRLGVAERTDYKGDEVTPLDEEERARGLPAPARRRRRGGRDLVPALADRPRARAARARALPRADAGRVRDGVERPALAGALLRPHLDDRPQRVRRADHHPLSGGARAPPRRPPLRRRAARDAVERRRRDARRGVRARRALAALGPGVGPDRRPLAPGAARRAQLPHDRHGRHQLRRRAREGRRAARDDRRGRRPLAARAADGRHPHDRRRRRLDRPRRRRRAPARRPAERRRLARVRPATAAAAPSRPSPTPTSCSASSTRRPSSAARCGSTARPPSRRSRAASPGRSASESSRRRPASTTSSTSRWRPASAR